MPNQDWYHLGDEIKNIVQDAIDAGNFNKLNQTINKTINNTAESVGNGIHDAGRAARRAADSARRNIRYEGPRYTSQGDHTAFTDRWINQPSDRKTREPSIYGKTSSTNAGGYALAITGGIFAGGLGCAELILIIIGLVTGAFGVLMLPILIMFPFLLGSLFMVVKGGNMLGRVKRFKNYLRGLHGRTFCEIKELVEASGKSKNFIIKDLRNMIERGMFVQGHLDEKGNFLIITDETYQQYKATQQQLANRKSNDRIVEKEEVKEEANQAKDDEISPEVQSVIEEGNKYIKKIRESNDAIPGVEISEKISHMELIAQKIFQRVEQHPEVIPDIRKFMDYYLPITVKLLDAYEELDGQPVQGDNITSSKKEIEDTLDTLNGAFENLLDSIFKDTAWDVSTDISVLQTMLAQEGLTKKDFK